MKSAIDVLSEGIERGYAGESSRSAVRDLQNDLRTVGSSLSQLPAFFPQLRKSAFLLAAGHA